MLTACLAILTGFAASAAADDSIARAAAASSHVIVPLSHSGPGAVRLVPAAVAGRDCRLVLDTGATRTVLDTAFAGNLSLTAAPVGRIRGFGGDAGEARGAELPQFSVGGLSAPGFQVLVADIAKAIRQPAGGGAPVAGILGGDFLEGFWAEIDYPKRQLRLRDFEGQRLALARGRWTLESLAGHRVEPGQVASLTSIGGAFLVEQGQLRATLAATAGAYQEPTEEFIGLARGAGPGAGLVAYYYLRPDRLTLSAGAGALRRAGFVLPADLPAAAHVSLVFRRNRTQPFEPWRERPAP